MLNQEPNPLLQYVCTYKFSQDPLELFFSVIRQQFGCNNNPSAKQFQSAMKKILLHLELQEDSSGNCIPLSNINIISFTSSLNLIATINKSANNGKPQWTIATDKSDCDNKDNKDLQTDESNCDNKDLQANSDDEIWKDLDIYDIALYCDKNSNNFEVFL